MAKFKHYQKNNGKTVWKFQVYLGTHTVTNERIKTTRCGFRTKKETQLALSLL